MKIYTRLSLSFLLVAVIPLLCIIGSIYWLTKDYSRSRSLSLASNVVRAKAVELSKFFEIRKHEVAAYANSPSVRTMQFSRMREFLLAERKRHRGVYEKFIVGLPNGRFYNTSGGNPYLGMLQSFNNQRPDAKLKSIAKRDYWQATIASGSSQQNSSYVSYVSEPMISYTTGVKQIVVASAIKNDAGKTHGMIGGAIAWTQIEQQIALLKKDLADIFQQQVRFMLVSKNGSFIYHWDPAQTIQLKMDKSGKPVLNRNGEKAVVKVKVTEDPIDEIRQIGIPMLRGQSGTRVFTDPATGED